MQKEGKNGRTYLTYRRKIEVFQEFLETRLNANDSNYPQILVGLRNEDVIASVEFYVENYGIRYKATTDAYFVILGVFFKFLWDLHGIQNEWFGNTIRKQQLKDSYEALVGKKLKLTATEQVMPPTDEQITELTHLCDRMIDQATPESVVGGQYNGTYAKYISSLIVKLTLLFGCKNQVIDNLPLQAFDLLTRRMTINGYSVHLPDKLALQMQQYVTEVRPKLVEQYPNDRLFVGFKIDAHVDNTQKYAVLDPVLHHIQGTAIAKYAIIQMIRERIPSSLIMEFTGCSTTIYQHCNELVEDESDTTRRADKSRLLDRAFRNLHIFDVL